MVYTLEEFISSFYKDIAKEKHPNISREELDIICRTIPLFIKHHMKRPDLPTIHIKHLGKFGVSYIKAIHLRNNNEADFRLGYISEEKYKERKAGYNKLVERIRERDGIPTFKSSIISVEDDTDDYSQPLIPQVQDTPVVDEETLLSTEEEQAWEDDEEDEPSEGE